VTDYSKLTPRKLDSAVAEEIMELEICKIHSPQSFLHSDHCFECRLQFAKFYSKDLNLAWLVVDKILILESRAPSFSMGNMRLGERKYFAQFNLTAHSVCSMHDNFLSEQQPMARAICVAALEAMSFYKVTKNEFDKTNY